VRGVADTQAVRCTASRVARCCTTCVCVWYGRRDMGARYSPARAARAAEACLDRQHVHNEGGAPQPLHRKRRQHLRAAAPQQLNAHVRGACSAALALAAVRVATHPLHGQDGRRDDDHIRLLQRRTVRTKARAHATHVRAAVARAYVSRAQSVKRGSIQARARRRVSHAPRARAPLPQSRPRRRRSARPRRLQPRSSPCVTWR
jgi:hypothetical protein